MPQLEDKTALVTGSDSGIGREIALLLAREGANVAVVYRTDERGANDTRQQVEGAGRRAVVVQVDLRDPEAIRGMFEQARAELGPIDILVNNAGTGEGQLADGTLEQWETVVNTNLRAAWLCAQEAANDMRTRGWGRIVNISSVAGKKPGGIYSVSKAGLDMLTRGLAQELTRQNINVNAISPGLVRTPMTASSTEDPEQRREQAEQIPVGRVGEPTDIASMALYMVSDKADYMSGANVVIDGGSLQEQGG